MFAEMQPRACALSSPETMRSVEAQVENAYELPKLCATLTAGKVQNSLKFPPKDGATGQLVFSTD